GPAMRFGVVDNALSRLEPCRTRVGPQFAEQPAIDPPLHPLELIIGSAQMPRPAGALADREFMIRNRHRLQFFARQPQPVGQFLDGPSAVEQSQQPPPESVEHGGPSGNGISSLPKPTAPPSNAAGQ